MIFTTLKPREENSNFIVNTDITKIRGFLLDELMFMLIWTTLEASYWMNQCKCLCNQYSRIPIGWINVDVNITNIRGFLLDESIHSNSQENINL